MARSTQFDVGMVDSPDTAPPLPTPAPPGTVDLGVLPDVNVTAKAPAQGNPPPPPPPQQQQLPTPNVGTQGQTSWATRRLVITFVPKTGTGKTYSGLRAVVNVQKATLGHGTNAQVRIQGMSLADINNFSRAGTTYYSRQDRIKVEAGDDSGQLTTVFSGFIGEAYPDFDNQPDVAFVVIAFGSTDIQLQKAQPQSINQQQVPIQQALQKILQPVGVTVTNLGVTANLAMPYFSGSVWQQMNKAVAAANAVGFYDSIKMQLTIWPKPQVGSGTTAGQTILISPAQGMIGYPKFQQAKLEVRAIFTPAIYSIPGMVVQVQSQLASANAKWRIYQVDLALSSEMPGGPWEMIMTCAPLDMQQ